MPKILIADDDNEIAELISDSLEYEGFKTSIVNNGADVIKAIEENPAIALILLDIMMPGIDGITICKQIRPNFSGSILFMSALNRTTDTLEGLVAGADDYITKPFAIDVLVAKVKAHIRREERLLNSAANKNRLDIGQLAIFKDSMEVLLDGTRIDLTTREFQLIEFMAENLGKTLSRETICREVWGEGYYDMNTVTVHIKNLRDKLDPTSKFIKTVWGEGYMLSAPPAKL